MKKPLSDKEWFEAQLPKVEEPEPPTPRRTTASDPFLNYAHRIAKGEGGGQYVYCLQEDEFYMYEDGIWRKIYETEFISRISRSLTEINKFPLSMRKQIIENFKVVKHKDLAGFNWTDVLTLKNKMLSPYDRTSLPHDPSYYSTAKLDYEYIPDAKCPLWESTLLEIFENDLQKIELLQEFTGYCLVPDMEQKKALLLLGESDTGKSTILFTMRDLIGKNNCSSVPLKYLSNPQYTPMMVNKLANIDPDVDRNAANYEAEFKMVTSGEPINCNQKFVETFEFIPKCKIILAANIFPKITDHSSAFYKRLMLIPCNRIFEESEKNRELAKLLKAELPGILNWAIDGLIRLKKRGKFEQHNFMKEAVQELEDENNPSNLFFLEHIEIEVAEGIYIEKGELYDKYRSWSERTKNYPLSENRFSTAVFRQFHKQTPKKAQHPTTGKRVWKNIRYVPFKSAPKAQEITGWQDFATT